MLLGCACGPTREPRPVSSLPRPPAARPERPRQPAAIRAPLPDRVEGETLASLPRLSIVRDRGTPARAFLVDAAGHPRAEVTAAFEAIGHPGLGDVRWDYLPFPAHVVLHRRNFDFAQPELLAAIEIRTGDLAWRREEERGQGGFIVFGSIAEGEPALLLTSDGITVWDPRSNAFVPRVRAIDSATGRDLWTSIDAPASDLRLASSGPRSVVLASRCGWAETPACPTQFLALDRDDGRLLGTFTVGQDVGPSVIRWAAYGPTLYLVLGESLLALDAEDLRARWATRVDVLATGIAADERVVAVAGRSGLQALSPGSGQLLWRRDRSWLLPAFVGGRLVAQRMIDESSWELHALDLADGRTRCRWNSVWARTRQHPVVDEPSVAACESAPPVQATLTGTLVIDGRPRPRAGVFVHGQRVVTDRRGSFTITLDALGTVNVEPDWDDLGRNPRRPCFQGEGTEVSIPASGRYEVRLEAREVPRACPWSCSFIDCE